VRFPRIGYLYGLYDVKRHAKGEIHNKAVEAQKTTKSMGCFFKKPKDKFDSQLIMAETICQFVFESADCR
jgi:UDP-N-acetylenolpyruvoylglucosamine reductase